MINIVVASLTEQDTNLSLHKAGLNCHAQVDIYVSQKPTARTATVSVAVWLHMHELSFTLKSLAVFVTFISAVYACPLPEATSTTVIEFVLPVGNLLSGVSCHVYFNFSHLNSR